MAGYTAIESPECTPARSMCSMTPGISTPSPSQIASTSTSLPSRYLSMRIGFPSLTSAACWTNLASSDGFCTISIARPPST